MRMFVMSVLILYLVVTPVLGADPDDFLVRNYDLYSNGSSDLNGRLFVPDGYDSNGSYPLVIFYHGLGEVGTNNTAQVNRNIDNLLKNAKSRDFLLYAPQTRNSWKPVSIEQSMSVVAGIMEDYSVDSSRLYMTGLSLGGGAARMGVSMYHDTLAATVPVCGVSGGTTPANLVGEPIWLHHGENDGTVTVQTSRSLVNAIRAADGGKPALSFPLNNDLNNPYYNNGSPYYSDTSTYYQENELRYTEYDRAGHGIWGRVYKHNAVYDWMLAKSNPIPDLQAGQAVAFDFGGIARVMTDSTGKVWNPTYTGQERTLDVAVPFAKDTQGVRTGVSLGVVAPFRQEITSGTVSTDGSGPDGDISIDAWLSGVTDSTGAELKPGVIQIIGLTPGANYAVELFGSHKDNDSGRGRITQYVVNGISQELDVVGNLHDKALFTQVIADPDGRITVEIGVPDGGNSRYGVISSMTVTALPEPASGLLLLTISGLIAGRWQR